MRDPCHNKPYASITGIKDTNGEVKEKLDLVVKLAYALIATVSHESKA